MVPVAIVACMCAATAGSGQVRKAVVWERMNEHIRVYGPPRDDIAGRAYEPHGLIERRDPTTGRVRLYLPSNQGWVFSQLQRLTWKLSASLLHDIVERKTKYDTPPGIAANPMANAERDRLNKAMEVKSKCIHLLESIMASLARDAQDVRGGMPLLPPGRMNRTGKPTQWGEPTPR